MDSFGHFFVFRMVNLVPVLSTILPIIASSLLVFVFSINVYLKLRRKFPISVNCWFCNSWTKVPYDDRNSFDCPTCLQYNGFTKDGGYNKIIPEQHDELMNKSSRIKNKTNTATNGLCAFCNNNQQLKIYQLANFVPLNEENYDVEIEHFQKQLEKAYTLCKKCDKVLKQTITKQSAWMFGNRVKNLATSSISKLASQIKKDTRLTLLTKIDGSLSVLLVFSVIFMTLFNIRFFTRSLANHIPVAYLSLYKNVVAAADTSRIIDKSWFPYVSKSVKIELYTAVCGLGLLHQVTRMIWGSYGTNIKVNQLLCWVILLLISWIRFNKNYTPYLLFIEAFSCFYLLSTAFSKSENRKFVKKTFGKAMRKLVKNLENTCSDVSDCSDFENISSSSKPCTSSRDSSTYLSSTLDVPQNLSTATTILNSTFVKPDCDLDINKSLNNLHLGFKPPQRPTSVLSLNGVKRPKPVLSPPKLQTVNSWIAGGFWKDGDGLMVPTAQRTNLSRSSSESSGFGSQHNDVLTAPKNHYFGEFDKFSIHSEPSRLSPISNFQYMPSEYRRNNTFYPNLQQNNMLLIQRMGSPGLIRYESYPRRGLIENWSDKINMQATQNFRDLSLRSTH